MIKSGNISDISLQADGTSSEGPHGSVEKQLLFLHQFLSGKVGFFKSGVKVEKLKVFMYLLWFIIPLDAYYAYFMSGVELGLLAIIVSVTIKAATFLCISWVAYTISFNLLKTGKAEATRRSTDVALSLFAFWLAIVCLTSLSALYYTITSDVSDVGVSEDSLMRMFNNFGNEAASPIFAVWYGDYLGSVVFNVKHNFVLFSLYAGIIMAISVLVKLVKMIWKTFQQKAPVAIEENKWVRHPSFVAKFLYWTAIGLIVSIAQAITLADNVYPMNWS